MAFVSRILLGLLLLGAAVALTDSPQLLTVNPGEALLDSKRGLHETLTWRLASPGGATSSHGEFVNLDNNRVLARVDKSLAMGADRGRLSESVRLSPRQAEAWYSEGVRRLGYRRTFSGPAGSLSNTVVIDLGASGRLVDLQAIPGRQSLTEDSREMMVQWQLRGDIGGVRASSETGYFTVADRVVYTTGEPLFTDGSGLLTERVRIPPWLVADLLDGGIDQLEYHRTFTDSRGGRRSATVTLDLEP
ncbi:hypothetical protein [Microbulbifer yueqingensis]|uniref:Uncharacterized protein n=1 Tax=Microbulbifer yueqingensis TaxID=658219 RepID=A0A1G9CU07_9GAMM|nr:hypothetical protein [Microbulbifer yueqingensis]SDK55116.1 hypothetical protein SAMN05216212_2623 [Microbulbifer yueqingensis]